MFASWVHVWFDLFLFAVSLAFSCAVVSKFAISAGTTVFTCAHASIQESLLFSVCEYCLYVVQSGISSWFSVTVPSFQFTLITDPLPSAPLYTLNVDVVVSV